MKFRWTIDQCDAFTDAQMLEGIINERISDLNRYSPLATRLKKVKCKIESGDALTGVGTKLPPEDVIEKRVQQYMFDLPESLVDEDTYCKLQVLLKTIYRDGLKDGLERKL